MLMLMYPYTLITGSSSQKPLEEDDADLFEDGEDAV